MDLSKIYLFSLFGILIVGIRGEHQLVKDRQKGALIGKLKTFQHKVSGTVWALDEDKLYLENFHYDGKGPDAFFWMGNDTQPSPRGFIVPYPLDTPHKKQEQLRRFQGEDVILHLPTGKKIVDMKYLSVWCRRFTVDFGHVLIPGNLDPPKKRVLPEFKRLAHAVRSGNVTILDAKTFYIPNLHYDGAGPDAFFWVGQGYEPNQAGKKIPNEMGKYDVLRGYEGEDIEIQLPDNLTVYDIDYLAIWCVEYRHNFGHVLIPPPSELWVPPSLGQTRIKSQEHPKPHEKDDRDIYIATNEPSNLDPSDFSNCRQLSDNLQVQWQARSNDVQIRLTARIEADEYVAFGLSHVQDRPEMLNSDVVVAYYDADDGSFHAVDYSMTKKSQCDGKLGVCPDERIHGRNDAAIVSGDRHNGVTSITYNRPYKTNDRMDIPIQRTSQFVTVIASIGTLNSKKEASYHNVFVTRDREVIDFTSKGENTCTSLIPLNQPAKYEPWPKNFIQGINNFTVAIGPTGGDRGYKAITGQTSWGIAWWVNGLLIPEIHVERGQTYYFQVEGGDDPRNPARFHPFYITDHPEGGFGQKSPEEQQGERVFAGVTYNELGEPQPNALGRLCEWQHASVDRWKESQTFDDYRNTLHLSCDYGSPGILVWTVMEDTPDLVYYQCYTHRNLGWEIHVHDPGYNLPQSGAGSLQSILEVWIFIVFIAFR